jgi:hypothetical protein
MESPNVVTVLTDTSKNIRYEVVAYRTLEQDELIMTVRAALSGMKRKPKKNTTCQLVTVIGARD